MKVVTLHIVVVELLGNFSQLYVGKVLLPCRTEHRKQIMLLVDLTHSVELLAKFLDQQSRVLRIGSGWELPIDIQSIEDAGGGNSRSDIPVDEQINAVRDHGLAAGSRARGRGETRSSGKRNQNLQIRMELLELLESGKVAEERPRVRSATHARKKGRLIIRPGIGDRASVCGGVAESIA